MNVAFDDTARQELLSKLAVSREGFRLATCVPIGLPVYKLTVTCVVLARKTIPPLEEFVLRSIEAGITQIAEIAGFLGLETAIVIEALIRLQQSEDVNFIQQTAHLTARGRISLSEASRVTAQEKTLDVFFDGLTRECYPYLPNHLMSNSQADKAGLDEFPPVPIRPPDLSELSRDSVSKYIRRAVGLKDLRIDVLELRRLERRERLNLPATALVFKSIDSADIEIGFLIDESLSLPHEAAVGQSRSSKRRTIAEQTAVIKEPLLKLKTATPEDIQNEGKVASTPKGFNWSVVPVGKSRSAKLSSAKEGYSTSTETQCFEHPALLARALKESKSRVLIMSRSLSVDIVSKTFLMSIERLIRAKVRVIIGFGSASDTKFSADSGKDARKKLNDLASKSKGLCSVLNIDQFGITANFLVSDSKLFVETSYNWLSSCDLRERLYVERNGLMYTEPSVVNDAFRQILQIVQSKP